MCNAAIYRPTAKEPEFTADGYETRSDPPVDPTPYAPNAGVQSSTHAPCNGRPLFLPRQSQRGAAAAGHNEVREIGNGVSSEGCWGCFFISPVLPPIYQTGVREVQPWPAAWCWILISVSTESR